jgi:endonuclease/exonuclease/phosphatase family metal-dependent hydrolase
MGSESPARRPVRVVAWNVWGCNGAYTRRQTAIEACLRDARPDVVALQESWSTRDGCQADALAPAIGAKHVEAVPPGPSDRADDRLVLMSRWPTSESFDVVLPSLGRDDTERRLLGATVRHPDGEFRVAVTHLSWRLDDGWLRRAQVEAIVAHLGELPPLRGPTILAGDLNAPPDADEIRLLTGRLSTGPRRLVFRDAWEVAGYGDGHTWSPDNGHVVAEHDPPCRLDYVMVEWRPDEPGRVHAARLLGDRPVDGVYPSDHFGVVVDVDCGSVS